jgi:hypothetical protein
MLNQKRVSRDIKIISHLENVSDWEKYAAGKVGCTYPMPVKPDTIADLAAYEIINTEDYVSLFLDNSFCTGYMGTDPAYLEAMIKDMSENEFSTTTGTSNESYCKPNYDNEKNFITFGFTRSYSNSLEVIARSETVLDLLFKLAAYGVKGTLNINFRSYPNGKRCYSNEGKSFKIIM